VERLWLAGPNFPMKWPYNLVSNLAKRKPWQFVTEVYGLFMFGFRKESFTHPIAALLP